jgi:hypothetical protein
MRVSGKFALMMGMVTALAGCATYEDVRPGKDGLHTIILNGDDEGVLAREAIDQGRNFCKKVHSKSVAVVSEEMKYVGDMDEKTYKNIKRGAAVAKSVGTVGYVFGGKNESRAGGALGLGGVAADSAAGNGYRYTMKFNCK